MFVPAWCAQGCPQWSSCSASLCFSVGVFFGVCVFGGGLRPFSLWCALWPLATPLKRARTCPRSSRSLNRQHSSAFQFVELGSPDAEFFPRLFTRGAVRCQVVRPGHGAILGATLPFRCRLATPSFRILDGLLQIKTTRHFRRDAEAICDRRAFVVISTIIPDRTFSQCRQLRGPSSRTFH